MQGGRIRFIIYSKLTRLIAFLLLISILAPSLSFNFTHEHSDDEKACHEESPLEKNACHIRVFHQVDLADACSHEVHLIQKINTCELCKYLVLHSKNSLLVSETKAQFSFKANVLLCFIAEHFFSTPSNNAFNKGPPVA